MSAIESIPIEHWSHPCDGRTRFGRKCRNMVFNVSDRCRAGHPNEIRAFESSVASQSRTVHIDAAKASESLSVEDVSDSPTWIPASTQVRAQTPRPSLPPNERPAVTPGQVTLRDVQPGLQFIRAYPNQPSQEGIYAFRVTSRPRDGWVDIIDVRDIGKLRRRMSLADAGIIPYPSGRWNTNWLQIVRRAPFRHRLMGYFHRDGIE